MSILLPETAAPVAHRGPASATPSRTTATGLVIAVAVCRIRAVASPAMKSSRQRSKTLLARVRERAFAQVDIASIVFFRIAFGLLVAGHICWYLYRGFVAALWIKPHFLFKYYGFSWVHPWPGNGLYIHWALLGVLAVFVGGFSLPH